MNESTRSAIIAGMAIFAVAYAAATLESTVRPDASGGDGNFGGGSGDGGSGILPVPQSESTPAETITIPYLTEILTVLAGILAIATIAYVIIYRRNALGMFLGIVASLILLYILSTFLDPIGVPPELSGLEPSNGDLVGEDGAMGWGDGDSVDSTQPTPPALLALLIVGLTVIGGLLALWKTKADGSDGPEQGTTGGGQNAAAIGRAAGRAADRLESEEDVDNQVYKTWREMAELTDIDSPESSTPGEFAAAAVETGLGREDVTELTRLFEDVRYGNAKPSNEREQQAITVFRRIESRYTEEDA